MKAKTIFNSLILFLIMSFFCIGLLVAIPIIIKLTWTSSYILISKITQNKITPYYDKSHLPNYKNISWAKKHFYERKQLTSTYYSYIVWKRDPFEGETIIVDENGFRKTTNSSEISNEQFWFFGGSTLWGYGANDENTIPSLFAKKSGVYSMNFAQPSYTTRQSINMLLSHYGSGNKLNNSTRTIISFEGANDVAIKCRYGVSLNAATQEPIVRRTLKQYRNVETNSLSPRYILEPAIKLVEKTKLKFSKKKENEYDCFGNESKADAVADSIVSEWKHFDAIAKRNGDKFIAILQPVLFHGNPQRKHLLKDKVVTEKQLENQFRTVYPKIIEKAKNSNFIFYDFTSLYDTEEYIYIDWCHMSPNGNKIIVDEIIKSL